MVWRPLRAESGKENEFEARFFLRHPDRRIVGLCRKKASLSVVLRSEPAARPGSPGKGAFMKLNNLAAVKSVAKGLVLGLAVIAATGAFASNMKGSVHVQEAVEINGQQIPAGVYEVRWEGTGANVELSFMQGRKEIAKTSGKVIQLDRAPEYDSALVDHSGGKATVSEVRFAGKKTAFTFGSSDRASTGGNMGK